MTKKQFTGQSDEVKPVTKSDQRLDTTDVAESKRAEWEKQQKSKD